MNLDKVELVENVKSEVKSNQERMNLNKFEEIRIPSKEFERIRSYRNISIK